MTSIKLINPKEITKNGYDFSDYGILVEVIDSQLNNVDVIRYSEAQNQCNDPNNVLPRLWIDNTGTKAIFGFKKNSHFEVTTFYFCLPYNDGHRQLWNHFGGQFSLKKYEYIFFLYPRNIV